MNNKPNYKKGYKNELIQLIYLCGIIPYRSLRLLAEEPRMYQRAAREMEREGIVVIDSKGGEKNLRLPEDWRANKEKYEGYIPEEYVKYHEEVTKNIPKMLGMKSSYSIAKREICNGNTKMMMYVAGIAIGPDRVEIGSERELNGYYMSQEIKGTGWYVKTEKQEQQTLGQNKDSMRNYANTRINGMLASAGSGRKYAVYNIGNRVIEWNRKGEVRIAACIKALERENCEKEAIIIARNYKQYIRIVNNTNEKGAGKRTLINIDYTYDHVYAVPEDSNGVKLLKILNTPNWKKKIINSVCSEEDQEASLHTAIDCDGYDEENNVHILVFCVPDLVKLKNFVKRAQIEDERSRYRIYCYDFQAPLIQELTAGATRISVVGVDKYINQYFPELKEPV